MIDSRISDYMLIIIYRLGKVKCFFELSHNFHVYGMRMFASLSITSYPKGQVCEKLWV